MWNHSTQLQSEVAGDSSKQYVNAEWHFQKEAIMFLSSCVSLTAIALTLYCLRVRKSEAPTMKQREREKVFGFNVMGLTFCCTYKSLWSSPFFLRSFWLFLILDYSFILFIYLFYFNRYITSNIPIEIQNSLLQLS